VAVFNELAFAVLPSKTPTFEAARVTRYALRLEEALAIIDGDAGAAGQRLQWDESLLEKIFVEANGTFQAPSGHASFVEHLLRRGASWRVSVAADLTGRIQVGDTTHAAFQGRL
jgi:hypothetical protein